MAAHETAAGLVPQDGEEGDYVLERVSVDEDSDDDFRYEEVDMDDDEDSEDEETLQHAIKSLQRASRLPDAAMSVGESEQLEPGESHHPEVMDDFVRNFLVKANMDKTLEAFQTEWYEKTQSGEMPPETQEVVPNLYSKTQGMNNDIAQLKTQLKETAALAKRAQDMWEKLRKERDFHRMHHKRVVQEKNKLIVDLKRLRKHYSTFDPAFKQLQQKYEAAMKNKMLINIEKEKLTAKVEELQKRLDGTQVNIGASRVPKPAASQTDLRKKTVSAKKGAAAKAKAAVGGKQPAPKKGKGGGGLLKPGDTPFPPKESARPKLDFDPAAIANFKPTALYKAHTMAVSHVAIHPRSALVATTSDDATWKLWSLRTGDLVMSGEGHTDWLSDCSFHPKGTHLASASADGTVKIWDFQTHACVHTFKEHKQVVWGCDFHHSGDFLASCSMDHSIKLWDLHSARVRQTLRGHMDSVNAVRFIPYTFLVVSCSGDKTVSVWDMRTGLCVQTFFGHLNACTDVAASPKGDTLASSDSDGIVKLWDTRTVAERIQIAAGPHAASGVAFDRSGTILAASSEDGTCKVFDVGQNRHISDFNAHEESCTSVAFDPNDQFLVTGGADCSFRVFS